MNARRQIRVLVADDHDGIRASLRELVEFFPWFVVVSEACDGEEAVALACELAPDLVLMDLHMPRLDGLSATARLREKAPHVKVLLLSCDADYEYAARALAVGAVGFLRKDEEPEVLWAAVAQAAGLQPGGMVRATRRENPGC
jgi:DNA-binding NarL/FixJ family response regulator